MQLYIYFFILILVLIHLINKIQPNLKINTSIGSTTINQVGSNSEKLDDVKKKINPIYGDILITLKGHLVRSNGEKLIANFLYSHDIKYKYEPKIAGLRPDFYLKEFGIIIEYWGMAYTPGKDGIKYRRSMQKKQNIYQIKKLKLISIYPQDISNGTYKSKISNYVPILMK